MRTSLIAAALALSAFAGAASAQSATYAIDSSHTFSSFSYNHFGLSNQQSRFNTTTGTVMFDKAGKTGAVDVVIDMKTVETGSSAFNGHIQGEDFLDTTKFPTATFKSTKVMFEGDKPAAVEGNLTIKGITKPVTLKLTNFVSTAHPMNKKDVIGANAITTIKRSEFGAGKFAPAVGDDVTITIAIEAIKQ
ncbi:MAG: YceI family protein [Rhodoferax sp.]|uniref:YceI family protein n=1 Tax=Rhodoferax sp. TaxID=50421 RepID=UPI002ACE8303|nr:YceI family protein [Rhodoferax sp.]MDZ7893208.1 YceI family protein [Rhodoferax sp.]